MESDFLPPPNTSYAATSRDELGKQLWGELSGPVLNGPVLVRRGAKISLIASVVFLRIRAVVGILLTKLEHCTSYD